MAFIKIFSGHNGSFSRLTPVKFSAVIGLPPLGILIAIELANKATFT
jgi:hypothetical protein